MKVEDKTLRKPAALFERGCGVCSALASSTFQERAHFLLQSLYDTVIISSSFFGVFIRYRTFGSSYIGRKFLWKVFSLCHILFNVLLNSP